jgi:hypothetical protein
VRHLIDPCTLDYLPTDPLTHPPFHTSKHCRGASEYVVCYGYKGPIQSNAISLPFGIGTDCTSRLYRDACEYPYWLRGLDSGAELKYLRISDEDGGQILPVNSIFDKNWWPLLLEKEVSQVLVYCTPIF